MRILLSLLPWLGLAALIWYVAACVAADEKPHIAPAAVLMLVQKTAGQRRDKRGDVDFHELDAVTNTIVICAMILYLSGSLDMLGGDPRGGCGD